MANLATSGVTTNAYYTGLGEHSKRFCFKDLTLTLTAMGTETNYISATVLGFTKICGSTAAINDGQTEVIPTTPNYTGSKLLFGGGASNAPADYTDIYNVTVWGLTY